MPALMGPSIGMLLKRHAGSDAVVVDFIKPGGLADQSGKVTVGDIIVAVNGVDVRSLPLPNICELMANRNHKAICMDMLRDGKPHQVILFWHQPSSRDVTGARLHFKC
jgi:C-terminal processing protease CtpA/Prc